MPTSPDFSGTATSSTSPSILSGTRRRIYLQNEHVVMVNRDKFDALESTLKDGGIFSHLAVALVTSASTLGIEMWVQYEITGDKAAEALVVISAVFGFLGLLFLLITAVKWWRYRDLRAGLFSEDNILSDKTHISLSDGTTAILSHVNHQ